VISVIDEPEAALRAGADSFLAKPVTPFKLTSTLQELLEGRLVSTILLADDDEVSRYLLGERRLANLATTSSRHTMAAMPST
jgi:DNA-binding NarL/FixJ family response regulator